MPNHDERAWGGMLNYASEHKWDEVVLLGDFLDNLSLNPHIQHKLRLREGLRFAKEQEKAKSVFNDLVEATSLNRKRKLVVCKGNHEAWIDQYIDRHPELEGVLKPNDVFEKASLILPYRQWALAYRVGKLHFLHGFGRGGLSQVRTWLNAFNVNLVGGHLHRMEQISKPSANGTIHGYCMGYLGRRDLGDDYVQGPTQWQHGFGVAYVDPKSGQFAMYPVVITKKGFMSPEGKFYKL